MQALVRHPGRLRVRRNRRSYHSSAMGRTLCRTKESRLWALVGDVLLPFLLAEPVSELSLNLRT